ncbi:uncharacterized protein LW93_428 [Fusarium fujikuroi]|nr:uncharacterized protein LW93_428 [Fusarium fujikuroi]
MADTANSWAKSTIIPDIDELELRNDIYELSLECLNESPSQDPDYTFSRISPRLILGKELETIDLWLEQIESEVLCRKLTLSIIGDGIRQIVDNAPQQPTSNVASHTTNAAALSSSSRLEGKLFCFLDAINKPDCFNCLYTASRNIPKEVIRNTSEGLKKIWDIWQRRETPLEGEDDESGDDAETGEEYNSRTWKIPHAADHPLDGVLIYRAVLITLLYSLACDSSPLISEDLGLIVPIM